MIRTVIAILCIACTSCCLAVKWHRQKYHHSLQTLPKAEIKNMFGQIDDSKFENILDEILIPRAVGTAGHDKVEKYITDSMKKLKWTVDLDPFFDKTPYGTKKFTNIVATHNPSADRRMVLACHYDSKMNREYTLLTATDSAVPCTMMIYLATLFNSILTDSVKLYHSKVTLQLIFFDGEEAFRQWTDTDSLYGSRHLARTLEKMSYPTGNGNTEGTNELDRMDIMVLLDLIGEAEPTFHNYFPKQTGLLYNRLVEIETELHARKHLRNHDLKRPYFENLSRQTQIQDDHVPFMERGVRILHLIPTPFPSCWHSEADNKKNLNFDTIINIYKILQVFVAEYLHLPANADS